MEENSLLDLAMAWGWHSIELCRQRLQAGSSTAQPRPTLSPGEVCTGPRGNPVWMGNAMDTTSPYLGCSGSRSSPRRRSSRRGPAGRSSAPCSPGHSGTSPGSCGQTGLPGRLEKQVWSALTCCLTMHCLCMAWHWLGLPEPHIAMLSRYGSCVLLRR